MYPTSENRISFRLFKIALPLLFLLFIQIAANAQRSTPQETKCFQMAQNKVAWNKAGNTEWERGNLQRLCKGTTNPPATIACFKNIISQYDDYERGIRECAGRLPNIQRPDAPTSANLNGNWDGFNADGSKSTYVWQIKQSGLRLSFVDVGAGTGTKFSGQIQGDKIFDSNGKTGTLSANRTQIRWSDGVVWKREGKSNNPVANPNNPPTDNAGSFTPTITIKNKSGAKVQAYLGEVVSLGGSIQTYKTSSFASGSSATLSGNIAANDSALLQIVVFDINGNSTTAMESILPRNSQLTAFCYEVTGTYYAPKAKACDGGDTYENKYILVKNEAGYNTKASLTYNQLDGSGTKTRTTATMTAGYQKKIYLPPDADTSKPMTFTITGVGLEKDVLTRTVNLNSFDTSGSTCYKAWGSIFSPKGDPCSTSGRKITFKNNGGYSAKMIVTYYDKDQSGNDAPTTVTGNSLEVLESDSIEVPVTQSTKPITVTIQNNWSGKQFFTTPVAANFTGELCFKSEGTTFSPNASTCDGTVGDTSGETRQIRFQNDAGYDAKMIVTYYVDEKITGGVQTSAKTLDTGFINGLGGKFRLLTIPKKTSAGQPITIYLIGSNTFNNQILTTTLPPDFAASPQPCFKTWGTLFNPSGGTCNQ